MTTDNSATQRPESPRHVRSGGYSKLIAAALFALTPFLPSEDAMANEEPAYTVLSEHEDYEIRYYEPMLLAQVDVDPAAGNPGNQAFRILAGYIFGDNTPQQKMNMTAPVTSTPAPAKMNMTAPVTSTPAGDGWLTYSFFMESRYSMDELPMPNNPRVRLIEQPAKTVAVRRYSGSWRASNTRKHTESLLAALKSDGLRTVGNVTEARYNAPFTPSFMRRNEVMIEVVAGD